MEAAQEQPLAFFGGRAAFVPLERKEDQRGALLPLEFDDLPFQPRRVFAIGDVPVGGTRGRHARKHGRQLLVCLAGRVSVELRWREETHVVPLEPLGHGLMIEAGIWSAQTYLEPGTVLLVIASERYEAGEDDRD